MNPHPRSADDTSSPGHSVLVIPVPELNGWIRARTAHYDASFLGRSPDFVNAHITVLGPWLAEPTAADLACIGAIAAATPTFSFSLGALRTFPDGIIYLEVTPATPFTALTEQVSAAFPDHPPYGGVFGSVVPHLTLDRVGTEVTVASVRQSLDGLVPTTSRAEQIDLQWWENDNCHVMASWPLRT